MWVARIAAAGGGDKRERRWGGGGGCRAGSRVLGHARPRRLRRPPQSRRRARACGGRPRGTLRRRCVRRGSAADGRRQCCSFGGAPESVGDAAGERAVAGGEALAGDRGAYGGHLGPSANASR